MAKELDYIVVDLEATCWEGEPPPGQESEIIEVGVAVLEVRSKQIVANESILVKPVSSEVSDFCTGLMTLTQKTVAENGVSLKEACVKLEREYRTKPRTWASYGDYDRRMFERQCQARSVKYPFGVTHINVKNWFALKNELERDVGMDDALQMQQIKLKRTHHRGVDDAYNIAKFLSGLLD